MIRKVVVYTYGNSSHINTIRAAASFACNHNADVMGLFVKPDVANFSSIYGQYPLNFSQAFQDLQKEYAAQAKKEFIDTLAEYQCRSEWHESAQYERQPRPALYADYIFLSQPKIEPDIVFNDIDFADRMILESGLPTVLIPSEWKNEEFGKRPLLGWKESREAAGAVRFTLPLMRAAKDVNVAGVSRKRNPDQELIQGVEICNYLSEHGVNCEYFPEHMLHTDRNEAETLLRHASDHNRDLLIIGGYSHSRFRELFLGGVTRALIRQSSVPVILAH